MNTHSHSLGKAAPESDPTHARFAPLMDEIGGHLIYRRSLFTFALIGAVAGAAVLGWLGYAVAEGGLPIAGLGQFAAAGWGVATFVGAGFGVALGGLTGGLIALFRLPHAAAGHHDTSH